MDTEQLKMILDMLASMGESGKDAFIWWLLVTEVLPFIVRPPIFFGIVVVIKNAIMQINIASSAMSELGDITGERWMVYLTKPESERIVRKIRQRFQEPPP